MDQLGHLGNLTTARRLLAGVGTQTAGLGFGGNAQPVLTKLQQEEYDGTSWTNQELIYQLLEEFSWCSRNSNCSFIFWRRRSAKYSANSLSLIMVLLGQQQQI
jgi:hypothetical protein